MYYNVSAKQNRFCQPACQARCRALTQVYASIISEKYCFFKATTLPYKRTTPNRTHKHCTECTATACNIQASPCNSVSAQNKARHRRAKTQPTMNTLVESLLAPAPEVDPEDATNFDDGTSARTSTGFKTEEDLAVIPKRRLVDDGDVIDAGLAKSSRAELFDDGLGDADEVGDDGEVGDEEDAHAVDDESDESDASDAEPLRAARQTSVFAATNDGVDDLLDSFDAEDQAGAAKAAEKAPEKSRAARCGRQCINQSVAARPRPRLNHDLHAIDATPARRRGGTILSAPNNSLVDLCTGARANADLEAEVLEFRVLLEGAMRAATGSRDPDTAAACRTSSSTTTRAYTRRGSATTRPGAARGTLRRLHRVLCVPARSGIAARRAADFASRRTRS